MNANKTNHDKQYGSDVSTYLAGLADVSLFVPDSIPVKAVTLLGFELCPAVNAPAPLVISLPP
jgi:hypothetical protein